MTRRQILGKAVSKGLRTGATVGIAPLIFLAIGGISKGSKRSAGGVVLSLLLCLVLVIPILLFTLVTSVVGALIGLAVGTVQAITRKPLGQAENHQLKTDLDALFDDAPKASKFTQLLIRRYERRRNPISKNSRALLDGLKKGVVSKGNVSSYINDEKNNGKRLHRQIHALVNESKLFSGKASKVRVNAKILAQGKRSPNSPLSKLPAELLVNILTYARPEGVNANAAQKAAQEIIRPIIHNQ